MKSQATILLFKTNFQDEKDLSALSHWLNNHPSVLAWNIDLEDCDKVLRIKSDLIKHSEVTHFVHRIGFKCSELE